MNSSLTQTKCVTGSFQHRHSIASQWSELLIFVHPQVKDAVVLVYSELWGACSPSDVAGPVTLTSAHMSLLGSQVRTLLDGGGQGAEMNSRAVPSASNAHDHLTFTLSLQLCNLSDKKQWYAEIWTKQGVVFSSCRHLPSPQLPTPLPGRCGWPPRLPASTLPPSLLQSHLGSLPKPGLRLYHSTYPKE